MSHRNGVVRATAGTTAVATLTTIAAVAALGKREGDNAVAPINAMSHIAFGDEAGAQDRPSAKYTATGLAFGVLGVAFWSFLQAAVLRRTKLGKAPLAPLVAGTAVSAAAYAVDYHLVPKRLTPGFEKRLSKESLIVVYAAMAAGLAAGALLTSNRERD